jgi:hypothetical protein
VTGDFFWRLPENKFNGGYRLEIQGRYKILFYLPPGVKKITLRAILSMDEHKKQHKNIRELTLTSTLKSFDYIVINL